MGLTIVERFKSKTRETETGCWEWTGAIHRETGYGGFWLNGRTGLAHRVSYELFKGEIETRLTIDHLCRNRLCVNPDHLEAVTVRENILRGTGPSAANSIKTHCSNGHEYTEDNTFWSKRGRQCKTCNRDRARERYRAAHPGFKERAPYKKRTS